MIFVLYLSNTSKQSIIDAPDEEIPIVIQDTGRVKLLSYAKFVEGKEVDHGHILTRKQYYHNIGMNLHTKRYQ